MTSIIPIAQAPAVPRQDSLNNPGDRAFRQNAPILTVQNRLNAGLADFVLSGINATDDNPVAIPDPALGLVVHIPAGDAIIQGKYVNFPGGDFTCHNNGETVFDLKDDGTMRQTYHESYATVPSAAEPGFLRVMQAGCDATKITVLTDKRARKPIPFKKTEGYFDWRRHIEEMRIEAGEYVGAFRYGPGGGKLTWVFANEGLQFMTTRMPERVKEHLNQYLAHCHPTYWFIWDAVSTTDIRSPDQLVRPDSTDSYASTFITLACKYVKDTGDWAWLEQNLPKLKNIIEFNFRTQYTTPPATFWPLIQTIQSNYFDPDGTPYAYDLRYLMDNCGNWAAMRTFAALLDEIGDPDAYIYWSDVNQLAVGISGLYDIPSSTWRWYDGADDAALPGPWNGSWYPAVMAQIHPHYYGVHTNEPLSVLDYASTTDKYYVGYRYIQDHAPQFWERPYDSFPSLMFAYYVALRIGDWHKVGLMLDRMKERFINPSGWPHGMLITDIGFYLAIQDMYQSWRKERLTKRWHRRDGDGEFFADYSGAAAIEGLMMCEAKPGEEWEIEWHLPMERSDGSATFQVFVGPRQHGVDPVGTVEGSYSVVDEQLYSSDTVTNGRALRIKGIFKCVGNPCYIRPTITVSVGTATVKRWASMTARLRKLVEYAPSIEW